MIDEGYHPMTMYFPLVVHGAMLIEPTESESKESLDRFIHVLREMALEAKGRQARALRRRAASGAAPPARRDAAARKPILRWKSKDLPQAAE
jgi:glycine dehydrogenase subunit 2